MARVGRLDFAAGESVGIKYDGLNVRHALKRHVGHRQALDLRRGEDLFVGLVETGQGEVENRDRPELDTRLGTLVTLEGVSILLGLGLVR